MRRVGSSKRCSQSQREWSQLPSHREIRERNDSYSFYLDFLMLVLLFQSAPVNPCSAVHASPTVVAGSTPPPPPSLSLFLCFALCIPLLISFTSTIPRCFCFTMDHSQNLYLKANMLSFRNFFYGVIPQHVSSEETLLGNDTSDSDFDGLSKTEEQLASKHRSQSRYNRLWSILKYTHVALTISLGFIVVQRDIKEQDISRWNAHLLYCSWPTRRILALSAFFRL